VTDRRRLVVPRQSQVFFYLILLLAAGLIWLVFKPFVIVTVTGLFVAVLALPIDRQWEKILPNRLAAVATMMTVLLILVLPLVGLGFALANDAERMAAAIQSGEAQEWLDEQLRLPIVAGLLDLAYPGQNETARNATLNQTIDRGEAWLTAKLTQLGKNLVAILPQFFIAMTVVLFVVYYILTDGDRLVQFIRRVAPLPVRQVDTLLNEARSGLHAVFVGQILTSLIQGGLGGVGFLIAGVPGAVLWASVMAILSLLPVVGAFLVWVPAALLLLSKGQYLEGGFLVVWGLVVVSQVDNFIRPRLIGNRANIHPLFVLIGVLGGVAAFGFIGLFLGPLLVGIFMSVLRVWEAEYLDPAVGSEDPTAAHVPPPRPPQPPGPPGPPEPPA
jgi:predicted PurR-regulated permease PerM